MGSIREFVADSVAHRQHPFLLFHKINGNLKFVFHFFLTSLLIF